MKSKKRIDYIDVLRGIGIIYMILGHINFGMSFDHYIHAFHMPLFFFVTGFFFNRKQLSFFPFLKKITKQLICPYLIWGMFFLIFASTTKIGLYTSVSTAIINLITTNNSGLPIAGALWYLTCFYFSQLILYFLNKYLKKEILFGLASMLIFALGILLHNFNITLWWSIVISFVAVGLIYFGYLIKKTKLVERFTNTNIIYTLSLFVLNYFFIMHTGYVNMRTGSYPNLIMFFFNLLLAIVVYINISKILLHIKPLTFVTTKIKYIGENSIVSLCLNQFVIVLCNYIFNYFHISSYITNTLGVPILVYNLFLSMIVISILYLLTRLFMSTKLRILFGKSVSL